MDFDLSELLAARLPGFNASPFMTINTSEACASTRLRQCRDFGTYANDISRKFHGPYDRQRVPDLARAEYDSRKAVVNEIQRWSKDMQEKTGDKFTYEYIPILYRYEVVKTAAKRERDWGHVVFIDCTTSRILLVMTFPSTCNCGNFSHHDYDALTKYHADRFMSLMKYVYHTDNSPKWVRASYVTPKDNYKLPPEFFDLDTIPTQADIKQKMVEGKPPVFHVTPEDFVPSLLESEVEKIDNLFARARSREPRSAELREQVIGSKQDRPEVAKAWKHKNARQCANCREIKESGLMICSRCKLVYYCSKECQRVAWPSHKRLCKSA